MELFNFLVMLSCPNICGFDEHSWIARRKGFFYFFLGSQP